MRIIALLFVALAFTPAFADEAAKSQSVDMTQVLVVEGVALKDIDTHDPGDWKLITQGPKEGERYDLDPNCEHCKPLTVGKMLARVLKGSRPDEQQKVTGQMRESWSAFGDAIKDNPTAKLSAKQVALLEERIEAIVTSGELIITLKKTIDLNYQPKLPE